MSGAVLAVAALALAPGLEYRERECTVAGRQLELSELRLEPGKKLELRALANPGAHPYSQCRDGYGGPDIDELLKIQTAFEVLGATNGTVFRESHGGYVSNSLVWSQGAGLIAPLRKGGGTSLFVADSRGGHGARLVFVPCKGRGKEACAKLALAGTPPSRAFTGSGLIAELKKRFPGMSLAVQSNMPLMDGAKDAKGAFTHWSRCPTADPRQSNDWRCRPLARTVLCSKAGGGISLFTTPAAYPLDLADGLRVGGACETDCVFFYNLDGGGSTQLSRRDPGTRELVTTGRKIETSQPGCSPFRPVDNYLVIGRPKN